MALPQQHSNTAFISPWSVQMVSPLRRFRVILAVYVNTAIPMNNSVEKAKSGIGNRDVNQWTSYFWVREMATKEQSTKLK